VKKASRVIIEKYYNRLTLDFDTNKRVCEEIAIIQSKRLRNKIAGFTTVRVLRWWLGVVEDGGEEGRNERAADGRRAATLQCSCDGNAKGCCFSVLSTHPKCI
jgi:ribosomal protein S17E